MACGSDSELQKRRSSTYYTCENKSVNTYSVTWVTDHLDNKKGHKVDKNWLLLLGLVKFLIRIKVIVMDS